MADNHGIDLNLSNFHIKQEWSTTTIKNEDIDYKEIIKTETEVVGESWVDQCKEELLENENKDSSLELGNAVEQSLIKTSGEVCGNCNMEYKDYCRNCEHLRAMQSVPKTILAIKGSLMEGYGVYALKSIPRGVMFGPYEGPETMKGIKLVEANDENYCSWMRFINFATIQSEQNLIALQLMGKIYYKTLRAIKIGEELLIYHSDNGCDPLELWPSQYFQPEIQKMDENIFQCPPCCFVFSAEKYLVTHKRVCPYKKKEVLEAKSSTVVEHTMEKSFKCNECSYTAAVEGNLLLHIKYCHTVEKRYKCDECSYATIKKSNLLSHIKTRHTMEKPYKCNECSYTSALKGYLLVHIKRCHTVEKPYKCDECSYATIKRCNLVNHIRSCHNMEKPYKCDECSFATALKSSLTSHIKSLHTMEKPYKCSECTYASTRNCDLVLHIKSRHTTEKPYKCNECSYTSARKSDLLTHTKARHTIEKPYKCNECSYATQLRCRLVTHIKCRHTTEKPYKCDECSYTAAIKCNLLSHIKALHTMEKHYKCNKCSYAAVHRYSLLTHIKNHHTIEKPYKCSKCSYTAVRKCELLSHIKALHTMEKVLGIIDTS